MKYKTIKVIELSDWDDLVANTYGKIYSFQQQDGCQPRGNINFTVPDEDYEDEMNDRIPEIINGDVMGVKFTTWLNRDPNQILNPTKEDIESCNYYWGNSDKELENWCKDKSHINMFWERNFYPNFQTLVNDLHDKGLIEAGEYSIQIDW